MDSAIDAFIDSILRSHLDNAKTAYNASPGGNSVSPLTNFVFETFLFNSLYSIDWAETYDSNILTRFDVGKDGPAELTKQGKFITFCRDRTASHCPEGLNLAFSPLDSLSGLALSLIHI